MTRRISLTKDGYQKWYQANRERICAYQRAYRKKNKNNEKYKTMRRISNHKFRMKHLSETKARQRRWYENVGREKNRQWRHKHRDRINAAYRVWLAANKEKYSERRKKWRAKNPERYRLKEMMRSRIYNSLPETKQKRHAYNKKRSWVLQRLISMARDDGTYNNLKWQLLEAGSKNLLPVRINTRLLAMARDDGTYQYLMKEYDNGKRSLRQTNAGPNDGKEHRRELQVG